MKNIHVLPTDKPSRLYKSKITQNIFIGDISHHGDATYNINIYITSDEYIGLSYYLDGNLVRKGVVDDKEYWSFRKDYKKIILTTDQDLINHGVQAIDDEFLEWFVKNPSCEWVEVGYGVIRLTENNNEGYWISIPNAEFNIQEEKPKQETLEEAAERLIKLNRQDAFYEGAKWQAERMYNEEDIIEFAEWIINQDWDETELNFPNNSKSTKELLQLWKEQKPKTVYYNG